VPVRIVHAASHSARAKAHKPDRAHVTTSVLTRELASAAHYGPPGSEGLATLTLTLSPSYRSLAARAGGLSATAVLTFTAPGEPTLHMRIAVLFRRAPSASAHAHPAHTSARPRKKRRKGR
jgi:hypothetical protein